jgi:hypothetical protein
VTIFGDVVLALSEGVPQFDGSVTGTRHDLTVVGREGDREDIVGVANEATGGGASVQIPEADSLVPGSRESKLAIRGDGNILNEMVVTKERLAGNAIVGFIPIKMILKARKVKINRAIVRLHFSLFIRACECNHSTYGVVN